MMDTDVKAYILVTGLVQGVGYRYFTQRVATQLGLRGCVRNLWNGDVEVVAEGPRRVIEHLIERLRRGPSMAQVEDVRVTWDAASGGLTGFVIRS